LLHAVGAGAACGRTFGDDREDSFLGGCGADHLFGAHGHAHCGDAPVGDVVPACPSAGYVHSMPKSGPATPAPQTEKSEEFAHLAEGTLVSAPKKERVEAQSRERARERSVSDD